MTEQEKPRLYAHVRGGYVLATGPSDFIRPRMAEGDEIMPYIAPTEPGSTINFIDRSLGEVRALSREAATTEEERAAWRTIDRAIAYPLMSDQIGAILKQLELMTAAGERHPEFQAILDSVAEVKTRLA
jgi:hypothetical protein